MFLTAWSAGRCSMQSVPPMRVPDSGRFIGFRDNVGNIRHMGFIGFRDRPLQS